MDIENFTQQPTREALLKTAMEKFGVDLEDAKAVLRKATSLMLEKKLDEAIELSNLSTDLDDLSKKQEDGANVIAA